MRVCLIGEEEEEDWQRWREKEGGRSEPSHWLVCAGRGERDRVCVSGSVNECSVMMETLRVPPNLENVTIIKNKQTSNWIATLQ